MAARPYSTGHRTRTRAIALAREANHSHSLAHALGIGGCLLDCMRGDEASAGVHADALLALAREHRFPYWLAAGRAAQGWLAMRHGRADAADILLDAIEQGRRACMEEFRPLLLAMLAEAYAREGRPELGLKAIDEALERVERSEERWIEAELHRLRGTLLLATGECDAAEASLRRAIAVARRHGARMWEARAEENLAALAGSKARVAPHSSIEIVPAADDKPGVVRLH